MSKVILDAAHGGQDPGEIYGSRLEKNDNLRLALEIGNQLKERGFKVAYTRTADIYLSQLDRVKIINQEGGDIIVSLERLPGPSANYYPGLEFYIYTDGGLAEDAALSISRNLSDLTFPYYGIILQTDIPILRDTKIPGLKIGIGYIRSEKDNELYDERFEDIAKAIADGVIDTLTDQPEINLQCKKMRAKQLNSGTRYRIRVGLFSIFQNARELHTRLLMEGYQAEVVREGEFLAVYVGDFASLDDAVELEQNLRHNGYHTMIISL